MTTPPPSPTVIRMKSRVRFDLPAESRSTAESLLVRNARKSLVHVPQGAFLVDAKMDVSLRIVRRAISAPTLSVRQATRANIEKFRKLNEFPQNSRSAHDLRAKMNGWGINSVKERDSLWNKMWKIWIFLVSHNCERLSGISHLSVGDFLPTSDAVFELITYICQHNVAYLPLPVPEGLILPQHCLANRSLMIDFMLKVGSKLELTKVLRKSDLLNPVVKFSKPRVIDFFFHLIEHINMMKEKGITLRRSRPQRV